MHRIARFLMLVSALLLPLQGVAGMTMKLCAHDATAAQALPATEAGVDEHCPYHEADSAPASLDSTQSQGCDNCGICHLACSGYLPASGLPAVATAEAHQLQPQPVAALASHIPEPPRYPPKRSA